MEVDTRSLFMAVDRDREREREREGEGGHHGQHVHLSPAPADVDLFVSNPSRGCEADLRAQCVRCELQCSYRQVYMLERCRHTLCLLCLYAHVSETLKEVLRKIEEKQPIGEVGSREMPPLRSFHEFPCPFAECPHSLSKRDIKIGAALFAEMDLAFPPLSDSLNDDHVDVNLNQWKGIRIMDLSKNSLSSSLSHSLGPVSLTSSLEQMIETFEEFIKCPNAQCQAVFERVLHDEIPSGVVTDENGVPLKGEALRDYHHNRFRCRRCLTVFCMNCKRVPYHLGFTCVQMLVGKGQRKECRFCHVTLPPEHRSYQELNALIDLLKGLEPLQKKGAIDNWLLDESMLDQLFNFNDPNLTEEQKAQAMAQRDMLAATIAAEASLHMEGRSIVTLSLAGVYRIGSEKPCDLNIFALISFKEDDTATLHTGEDVLDFENRITMNGLEYPITKVVGLRNSEMSQQLQLFAGDFRFDGELELIFTPESGRVSPIFAKYSTHTHALSLSLSQPLPFVQTLTIFSTFTHTLTHLHTYTFTHIHSHTHSFKGYLVRVADFRFCGTFVSSVCFEPPQVEGTQFYVCAEEECALKMQHSCKKIHHCGHICHGVDNEHPCLPCLQDGCPFFGLCSSSSSSSSSISLEVGMRLEAVDILTAGYVCVATIEDIHGDNVRIHFDGWGEKWDYWCPKSHANLGPIGSCERLGERLNPPRGLDFPNWDGYLQAIGAKAVPKEFFCGREFRFPSRDNWVVNTSVGTWKVAEYELIRQNAPAFTLEVGMRLEAVDILTAGYVCVATIADIHGDNVRIHFDGWGENWDYWCPKSHANLGQIGSCEKVGSKLQPPRGSEFPNWEGYLQAIEAKAVPKEFFCGREFRVPPLNDWVRNTSVGTWTVAEYVDYRETASASSSRQSAQNCSSDYCAICYIEDLAGAPSALLGCGHVFHVHCLKKRLENDGSPDRITFAAVHCPQCNVWMQCSVPLIASRVLYFANMKKAVDELALRHLKLEGLDKSDRVTKEGQEFFNKPLEFALHIFDFFICANCSGVMYGGHHVCGAAGEEGGEGREVENGNLRGELIAPAPAPAPAPALVNALEEEVRVGGEDAGQKRLCPSCRSMLSVHGCRFHGGDRTIFKCRFCCAVATYFCGGMCHYCDPCHARAGELTDFNGWLTKDASKLPKCEGKDSCPLGIAHPPNGLEFPIGCSVCRERGALGLSSKVFLPLGAWLYALSGHFCRNATAHFPPLFGSGEGFEVAEGESVALTQNGYVLDSHRSVVCRWENDSLRCGSGNTSVQIFGIPYPIFDKIGPSSLPSFPLFSSSSLLFISLFISLPLPSLSPLLSSSPYLFVPPHTLPLLLFFSQIFLFLSHLRSNLFSPSLPPGKKFGIMCSVYMGGADVGGPVVSMAAAFSLTITKSQVTLTINGSTAQKSCQIAADKWVRVMVCADDTEVCFALETKYIGEVNSIKLPVWNEGDVAMIGRGNGKDFSGKIRDVSLWFGDGDISSYDLFANDYQNLILRVEEEKGKEKE